jgi:glucosylglycerate phosphorylase
MNPQERILHHLQFLYGRATAAQVWPAWEAMLADFTQRHPHLLAPSSPLDQTDAILITYGDQFLVPGEAPLRTLGRFLDAHLRDALRGVHILPFYPYTSDDGFSVVDYRQVDPALGAWEDVQRLGEAGYRLMFDAVINHISAKSAWFQGFLRGDPAYQDYFISVDPGADLSQVVRPRALPLLTRFETACGPRHVWTTFSEDQIDLNFANPRVLLEISRLLLEYAALGAQVIRLDAIAYLWKEIGTACIHLPQTHAVVKLWRALLDAAAPGVLVISETNVPHAENISYFGAPLGRLGDEAQLVYQFPLAPLTLHTFQRGSARALTDWAAALTMPFPTATFFNFIASHDGIGVRPAEGLLTPAEIHALGEKTLQHGGKVSYKNNPDGTQSAYELNITLYAALNDPARPNPALDAARFLASQAIMLSLAGVPGIYVHSLFGSPNCQECLQETGRFRSLNRQKFQLPALEAALADPASRASRVFNGYKLLLSARRAQPAFHPQADQRVLSLDERLFAVLRGGGESQPVLCLVNVTSQVVEMVVPPGLLASTTAVDLLSGDMLSLPQVRLQPYQARWLAPA